MHAVVDTAQQHALVAQWHAGIGQHLAGATRLGGHLVGVVEVGVEPHGVIFLEHCAQFGSDALRAHNRCTGAQTDNLDVWDGTQTRDNVLQTLVAHHQGVTSRQQHVAHALGLLDILQSLLDAIHATLVVGLAGKAATGAVAAIHRAHVGDEEQHTVGIAVCQAWCGRVFVFVQRVEQVGSGLVCLKPSGDALTAHGIVWVIGIDQTQVVGCDSHAQGGEGLLHALFLLGGKAHIFLEFFKCLDAVFHLPLPVVPLLVGDFGKELFSSRFSHNFCF